MDSADSMMVAPEVGAVLKLPVPSVWKLARDGTLPCVMIGRLRRFPRAAIMAIAAGQPVPAAAKDA